MTSSIGTLHDNSICTLFNSTPGCLHGPNLHKDFDDPITLRLDFANGFYERQVICIRLGERKPYRGNPMLLENGDRIHFEPCRFECDKTHANRQSPRR